MALIIAARTDPPRWSRMYVAYACEQGREPAEQLEVDRAAYPSGSLLDYYLWHRRRLVDFSRAMPGRGHFMYGKLTTDGAAAFVEWLTEQSQGA